MGKRGPKPKQIISTQWNSDLAYALGLLASDGSFSKDGRHVDFTSEDRNLVKTLKKCVNARAPVTEKYGGGRKKKYFRIQISSAAFYNWLKEIGFTANKSKTLGALDIPDKYFFDFFRGCFDGDGSIYGFKDKRWKNSYNYYLTIASASPHFLRWLQRTIERLAKINGTIHAKRKVEQLQFAKTSTQKIAFRMYYNKDLPRLHRKFTKLQKMFKIDRAHCAGDGTR